MSDETKTAAPAPDEMVPVPATPPAAADPFASETIEERETRHAADSAALQLKLDEAKVEELGSLNIDFDKALAEYRATEEYVYVRFNGKRWPIPPTAPANFVLFYLRECITEVEGNTRFEVPDDKFAKFLELMLGEELGDEMVRSAAPMGFILKHVLNDVLNVWGLGFSPAANPVGAAGKTQATLD